MITTKFRNHPLNVMRRRYNNPSLANNMPILPLLEEKPNEVMPLRAFARIFSSGKGKKELPLNALIQHKGNIKIPSSTAIFNMSSATDCPSKKLGLCKACEQGVKCYAEKSEYSYRPDVLPYRRKQEIFWKGITSHEFVYQFLLINALKENPFDKIRFNESGDFHTQTCVDKLEAIATMLKRFGIVCYCYTSRSDLDFSKVRNLVVSGSGFTKEGITNQFKIVKDLKDRPKGFGICAMDCHKCSRCTVKNRNTVVKAH